MHKEREGGKGRGQQGQKGYRLEAAVARRSTTRDVGAVCELYSIRILEMIRFFGTNFRTLGSEILMVNLVEPTIKVYSFETITSTPLCKPHLEHLERHLFEYLSILLVNRVYFYLEK